uniref:Uncharacterized protein n=1 Tax=Ditylenchus dipsaci TaxID=166011 RepID=A0A915DY24_9BILA
MTSYSFEENEQHVKKKCCKLTFGTPALLIGVIGSIANLIDIIQFVQEIHLIISLISLFTCLAVVVSHFKKKTYLYLPFLVFNAFLILYYITVLIYLIFGLRSGRTAIQKKAGSWILLPRS